ncbi:unknown [Clostridium sp. CAG:590]|nr:unknown [Clostridium sp. CAG:590]
MQKNGKLKNKNAKALWKMNALHSVCFWFVPICGEDFSWDNYEVVK